MRTLNLNKTKLWKVTQTGVEKKVDSNGFLTGERIKTYGTPEVVYIHLYPATGEIVEQIFGKDSSFDKIAVSTDVVLEDDCLLFLSQPVSHYDQTYDYKLSKIVESLNVYNYGLKARI